MNKFVDLAPNAILFSSGITKYVKWDVEKLPHLCIFGSTGSGKTYFLKIILGRIAKSIPDAELIVCDFKADDDFSYLISSCNFYRFTECINGLERIVSILGERQQNTNADCHPVFFVFDEWASFVTYLDKKAAENARQKLALLLMLGRSFQIHVIISQQRMDASHFGSARDNFSVIIGMGKLSKESIDMMFREYKDVINPNKERGTGSIVLGHEFKEVLVPMVRDVDRLHRLILSVCTCPKDRRR